MTRDPARVDKALAQLVREQSKRAGRPAEEAEVRAALAPLSPAEEQVLRALLREAPPARPLGPFAWADLARGTQPQIAAARELGGYYALQAERDALAAMVKAPVRSEPAGSDEGSVREPPAPAAKAASAKAASATGAPKPASERSRAKDPGPVDAARAAKAKQARPGPAAPAVTALPPGRKRVSERAPRNQETKAARSEHLLGLFGYHRDGPRVARALGLALVDLDAELDQLKIRRKAYRLTRGSDLDSPVAAAIKGGKSSAPLRRRAKNPPPGVEVTPAEAPPVDAREAQARALKALLAEVGPRRAPLAERLGLSEAAVLARFRAAGLEREFALRERDLLRALWTRHRASEARVAKELGTTKAAVRSIALDRGLARELDRALDKFRHEVRLKRWPRERIHLVLHEREQLAELSLLDEMEKEVATRVRLLWAELNQRPKKAKSRPQDELRLADAETRTQGHSKGTRSGEGTVR